MKNIRYLGIAAMLVGVVGLVMGIVFIVQSVSVKAVVVESLRAENVTTALPTEGEKGYFLGNVIDTASEALAASEYLEGHLRESYGTYGDTERGSDDRATYLDGTTLRNSLNLAVLSFGVTTIALGAGIFMLITGIALGGAGFGLYRLCGRKS